MEVIVVDGGSDDDTAQPARSRWPTASCVDRAGAPPKMNEGAKVASGFIFLFLPSDTTLPADADTQVMYGRARDTSVWGRFDMRLVGEHAFPADRRAHPELALAHVRHCLERASDLRAARNILPHRRFHRYAGDERDVEISKRLKAISPPICVASRVTVPGQGASTAKASGPPCA